jgi:hypothetical protein
MLLAVSLLVATAAVATAATAPTLRLVGTTAVQGKHFAPRTTVRLVFVEADRQLRRVRTSKAGAFTVPLPTPYERCTGLTVTATAPGGRVVRLAMPRAECAPARLALANGTLEGESFPAGAAVRIDYGTGDDVIVHANAAGTFAVPMPDGCTGGRVMATVVSTGRTVSIQVVRPKLGCQPVDDGG